ncbi:MAG: hypothetical protein HY094_06010 [Candidatus Melainabacteria bacterium]|nr:hypothetical protein [Candidatus Melainabacteria bacterium]
MPNLCQTDRRSKILHEDKLTLCSPVSISNILIHLAKKHFPFIVPSLGKLSETEAQFKLIDKLTEYMNVDDGTSSSDLIEGLKKYIRERGYKTLIKLEECYEGQKGFTPELISDPLKIMPHIVGASNAILSVAFCKFDLELAKYELIELHHVTLSGFISNGVPRFIIHDPSPATEREAKLCKLSKISKGTFYNWDVESKLNACGFNELEGINIYRDDKRKGANKIVLNGVLAFEVYIK